MQKSRKKKKNNNLLKVFLSIFLIFIVIMTIFLYKRYSYTNERMSLDLYFGSKNDEVIVYYNDKKQALQNDNENQIKKVVSIYRNEEIYLPYSFVKSVLNNVFYYETDTQSIIYSNAKSTDSFSERDYYKNKPCLLLLDEPYISISFIKEKSDIRYDFYETDSYKRVFIYDNWEEESFAILKGNEKARYRGGNKSPILSDLNKGDIVKVLDKMNKWCLVKTPDGFLGYIRNKKMEEEYIETPKSEFIKEKINYKTFDKKVLIAFHQLWKVANKDDLQKLIVNMQNVNVLSPTWFKIADNQGNIISLADNSYVEEAHLRGLQIWPTINNFDIENIITKTLFSSHNARSKIINTLVSYANDLNLDGINLDIEDISREAQDDYVQFIRECSIAFKKINKYISVCQSIPSEQNDRYHFSDVAKVVDYMVLMLYDEHTSNGGSSGPVSSLNFVKRGIELSLSQMDNDRLVIALPFYTRVWTTDSNGKISAKSMGAKAFDEQKELLELDEYTWDSIEAYNYASKTKNGTKTEVWVEDIKSLNAKMKEVENANVAGTAAWKLGMEMDGFFSLIDLN
ncbi:MAG: glycosyl hydrolase family 18 protein [Eubacteriales bacterium]|nr:glycosyl hydrolase family 18 protein [Eubacteriales bacterium]